MEEIVTIRREQDLPAAQQEQLRQIRAIAREEGGAPTLREKEDERGNFLFFPLRGRLDIVRRACEVLRTTPSLYKCRDNKPFSLDKISWDEFENLSDTEVMVPDYNNFNMVCVETDIPYSYRF